MLAEIGSHPFAFMGLATFVLVFVAILKSNS